MYLNLLKRSRGMYAKYQLRIISYIRGSYHSISKIRKRKNTSPDLYDITLKQVRKFDPTIIHHVAHSSIFETCNIPRSSYYDVIKILEEQKLIRKLPSYVYKDPTIKSTTVITITHEHLMKIAYTLRLSQK